MLDVNSSISIAGNLQRGIVNSIISSFSLMCFHEVWHWGKC